mgnify:CR=1 FL=1
MDHKRIEWLFFVVFFLIDIYLGIEILRSPVNLSNADTTTRSVASIRNETILICPIRFRMHQILVII